jgi:hypothetical protein
MKIIVNKDCKKRLQRPLQCIVPSKYLWQESNHYLRQTYAYAPLEDLKMGIYQSGAIIRVLAKHRYKVFLLYFWFNPRGPITNYWVFTEHKKATKRKHGG